MKKTRGLLPFCLLALALALGLVLFLRLGQQETPAETGPEFVGLRQREDQIIAYCDDPHVELYFHNPEDAPTVEIRPQVCFDGGYDLTEPILVAPGETVTLASSPEPEGIYYFVPGIWYGRILVFDAGSGDLLDRVGDLEMRLYEHLGDDYDSLPQPEVHEVTIDPNDTDFRTDFYSMSADLKLEELLAGVSGLSSQDRDLDVRIWLTLDDGELLLARCPNLGPHSIYYLTDMLPGTAERLEPDRVYEDGRVDVYYSDTGELWYSAAMQLRTYRTA